MNDLHPAQACLPCGCGDCRIYRFCIVNARGSSRGSIGLWELKLSEYVMTACMNERGRMNRFDGLNMRVSNIYCVISEIILFE